MDQHFQVRIRSVLSYAVRLVDMYTRGTPFGSSLSVRLANHPQVPVCKGDGWYIFTDLPDGIYTLTISSLEYMDQSVSFSTTGSTSYSERIIYLHPSPTYPFKVGDFLVRGRACVEDGSPAEGAYVQAVISYERDAPVRLAEDADKEATELIVASKKGQVDLADAFLLETPTCKGTIIRFAGPPSGRVYPLTEPLSFAYPRGTVLLPLLETNCDDRGEFVVALPLFLEKTHARMKIEVRQEEAAGFAELSIQAGTNHSIGIIQMNRPK
ncbi:carboxypeptidase-like regulatory domain-containing protein [Brevibacillus antibioticus]|uniref:Carboxypeptidase-like regulatory domain-containing protein n=1 Tax=Brevibacillus antibioticus TaxID=2570228 RepID=A0A4U2Y5A3_9BACL|nr:carboxypeptidase-like regulatory domain-containing protein [Brevibacillus antibioticus]TKI54341.1 carboxypeptidase-like regulatory domain-containing protein [Brevibacillus antibioticus]